MILKCNIHLLLYTVYLKVADIVGCVPSPPSRFIWEKGDGKKTVLGNCGQTPNPRSNSFLIFAMKESRLSLTQLSKVSQ